MPIVAIISYFCHSLCFTKKVANVLREIKLYWIEHNVIARASLQRLTNALHGTAEEITYTYRFVLLNRSIKCLTSDTVTQSISLHGTIGAFPVSLCENPPKSSQNYVRRKFARILKKIKKICSCLARFIWTESSIVG